MKKISLFLIIGLMFTACNKEEKQAKINSKNSNEKNIINHIVGVFYYRI